MASVAVRVPKSAEHERLEMSRASRGEGREWQELSVGRKYITRLSGLSSIAFKLIVRPKAKVSTEL